MMKQLRPGLFEVFNYQSSIVRTISSQVKGRERRKFLQQADAINEVKFVVPRPSDRRIYAWGLASTGALGVFKNMRRILQQDCYYVSCPTRIQFAEQFDVKAIAAGYGFSLYVTDKTRGYTVFGTGFNTDSQLGYQENKYRHMLEALTYPAPIDLPHDVTKVAAGRAHSMFLTEAGIYTLGNNSYGQCGRPVVREEEYLGSRTKHLIEVKEPVRDIICGQDHSMILMESGKVLSFGWGADGQTGLGHFESTHEPTEVYGDIKSEDITKIVCSGDCNLALNSRGEVFGWGNTEYGQLVPDQLQVNVPRHIEMTKGLGRIIDIAAGGSYCGVVNENGDVFTWGFGILGFGPQGDYVKQPKQIPPTLFGRNDFNPNARITKIASGLTHIMALDDKGDLFAWGLNKYGCLGLRNQDDQFFPLKVSVNAVVVDVKCGADHTLALCKSYVLQ